MAKTTIKAITLSTQKQFKVLKCAFGNDVLQVKQPKRTILYIRFHLSLYSFTLLISMFCSQSACLENCMSLYAQGKAVYI